MFNLLIVRSGETTKWKRLFEFKVRLNWLEMANRQEVDHCRKRSDGFSVSSQEGPGDAGGEEGWRSKASRSKKGNSWSETAEASTAEVVKGWIFAVPSWQLSDSAERERSQRLTAYKWFAKGECGRLWLEEDETDLVGLRGTAILLVFISNVEWFCLDQWAADSDCL